MAQEVQQRLKWYVAHVGEGREERAAGDCAKLIGPAVLADCFVPRAVRLKKRGGEWLEERRLLYPGYLFLLAADARRLEAGLRSVLRPVRLLGKGDAGFAALEDSEQALFERMLDDAHLLRASEGVIRDGCLEVQSGPLVGMEGRIRKVDRHKRTALVDVGVPGNASCLVASLKVPSKS